jgi:hypothetical protein
VTEHDGMGSAITKRRQLKGLCFPLPGVREDVVFCVPREARFVWPEELRQVSR